MRVNVFPFFPGQKTKRTLVWAGLPFFFAATWISFPYLQTQQVLRHDAAAVIKLVPVRVIDQNGRPVTNLKKEDFVLYDNSQRQTITEFEIHGLDQSGRAADKTVTDLAKTVTQETNRQYFIFLDIQASDVNGVSNAKKAALEFLETNIKPGDEVGVLTYTPLQGLNLAEFLTPDKQKIKKAIERAKDVPPTSGYNPAAGSGTGLAPDLAKVETHGLEASVRVSAGKASRGEERGIDVLFPGLAMFGRSGSDFQSNMSELAKAMQYIPGLKNVVFFSSRSVNPNLGREFAAANTVIFSVNTQNWIVRGGVKEPYIFTEHPLKEFALASGGQYFADIKDVQTIADDLQILSGNYYVLGYYINEQWDGKLHQIKVEVGRPEVRVFVQAGYNNPKPFAQWTPIERQLHLYDLAFTDTPARKDFLDVPLEALFGQDEKGSNCLFLAKMPVDEKTGIPPRRAELYAFVFDEDDKVVQSVHGEIDLTSHAQKIFYPYGAASLKPGEYDIRFVARDMMLGQTLLGKSKLTIPKAERSGLQFYSPLLLIPGGEPQFLQMTTPREKSQRTSLINFYPLLPIECSPLVKTMTRDDRKILAVFPSKFRGSRTPQVNLDFRLSGLPSGLQIPLEARILESKKIGEERSVLVVELNLPELEPGDYELEIKATESTTQAQTVMKSVFSKR